ncbi:putative nucleolar complex protein [Dioscorea sansibarensis]
MGANRKRRRNKKVDDEVLEDSSPVMSDAEGSVGSDLMEEEANFSTKVKAKEHKDELQRLQEKDPEFYQYLKDFDKELLDFNDEEFDDDEGIDVDDTEPQADDIQKPLAKAITSEMIDTWCKAVKDGKLGGVRSMLRAFRTACHYGDDGEKDSPQLNIISSVVFNKIMVFVLNEMDGVLRGLLKVPGSGGKKETILELTTTPLWKKHGNLMRIYLGNALHILNQMTDEQMISFTLKRVKASAVFLAAFPSLLRKYIKVALHIWGTGRGALPVVSFLLLRDLCVRIGTDCLDTCLKGVYKAYVLNCKLSKSASRSNLQHIYFLGNCITELYGIDPPSAYQHAFVFIRQLATILRGAVTERGPKVVKDKKKGKKQQESSKSTKKPSDKAYQKVFDWQFICCLELWTSVICAYNSEADFRPLAYPLTQIISGVACLVPTARYFPVRIRCIKMLNRLAAATGTFVPVSSLLLDMLEMKELNRPPTGGIGKAVNFLGVKQLDKTTLKTRAFQEACVFSIVEELTEHLAQWSYSVAFFELSFILLVRLRSFCKSTKVDKFRREIKELIREIEANLNFTNSKRMNIEFSPDDPAVESFLKVEKESGSSPLSKYAANIRLKAQQRSDAMVESSVIVGAESSVFGSGKPQNVDDKEEEDDDYEGDVEEGAAVFSSSWMPEKKPRIQEEKSKPSKKRQHDEDHDDGRVVDSDEDIVEDLVLSSDDDDESGSESPAEEDRNGSKKMLKQEKNKQSGSKSKKRHKPRHKRRKKGAKP